VSDSLRPVPVPDERSAPFWRAAAEHTLTVACCGACGQPTLPPDVVCPHCGSTTPEFSYTPVSGRATVKSWTVMRQSFLPGFESDVPFVLVDVELADAPQVRMIGRLLDGEDPALHLDAQVGIAWEDLTAEVSVPAFRLMR